MGQREVDVLVIGAGPSGSVAAAVLHNQGVRTAIVEKQKFPRFVIGESLLPRCMDNLAEAGLLEVVKEHGFQKKFGAKFTRNGTSCDFDFSSQFTKGWDWTWQVKRAEFDHLLAQETQRIGVELDYETQVIGVKFLDDHSSLTTVEKKEGSREVIQARYIIDASGYGRVLPRLLDLDRPSDLPPRASLFCHLQDPRRPAGPDGNRITYVIYDTDTWIWIIPFSDGTTSVGVVGNPDILENTEVDPATQYREWLERIPELEGRFSVDERLFEPRKISGYATAVKRLYDKGYVLTGNSTGFLDPVFSSGVTLATESGALAARLIARELQGGTVNWEEEYTGYLKTGVDVFETFVKAWYDGSLQKIFFSEETNTGLKNQICSVLAGYVWDLDNPFVRKHARALKALANVLK